jgi:Ca2+-transporting ATPase
VGCSIIMELSVIYLPILQPIFKTVPLNIFQWFIILLFAGWKTLSSLIVHLFRPLCRKIVLLRLI